SPAGGACPAATAPDPPFGPPPCDRRRRGGDLGGPEPQSGRPGSHRSSRRLQRDVDAARPDSTRRSRRRRGHHRAAIRGRRPARPRPDGRPDAGPPDPGAIPPVRLADVAGCEEAKLELTETIEFLRSPARFQRLGARIPHGVLLFGPPGTGKTMLARAVAAEAEVPFLAASGAEFIEKYVGVGSRRVRELFAQASSPGRAVIF